MSGRLNDVRVLLVEDMPDQQRLFLKLLERAGAEVTLECDGFSAVRTARRAEFDAIVMDLKMPGIDGIESTLRLRSNGFAGPIVAFTANGENDTETLWFQAGCSAFLSKTSAYEELVPTIVHEIEKACAAASAR